MLVGCFGKLPLSPEFIKVNANGSTVRVLDQWLQEGIHHARSKRGQTWSQDFLQADTWNFVFAPEGKDEFLVGVASPNQDRAGRTFPFFVYLVISKSEFKIPSVFASLVFESFLRTAKELVERGWKDTDLSSFKEKIQTLPVQGVGDIPAIRDEYETYLHSRDSTGLLNMWLGELPDGSKDELPRMLKNYFEESCQILGSPAMNGIQVPLLLEEGQSGFQVVFLPELASRILRKDQTSSTVFWVPAPKNGPPYMFLFFQDPSPKVMLNLICSSQLKDGQVDGGENNPTSEPREDVDQTLVEFNERKVPIFSFASLLDSTTSSIPL